MARLGNLEGQDQPFTKHRAAENLAREGVPIGLHECVIKDGVQAKIGHLAIAVAALDVERREVVNNVVKTKLSADFGHVEAGGTEVRDDEVAAMKISVSECLQARRAALGIADLTIPLD